MKLIEDIEQRASKLYKNCSPSKLKWQELDAELQKLWLDRVRGKDAANAEKLDANLRRRSYGK